MAHLEMSSARCKLEGLQLQGVAIEAKELVLA